MAWGWGGWGLPPFISTKSTIGTTSTDGFVLTNPTAAAANAQQISPRMRWTGQGWKTDAVAASQTVDWKAELVPVQGAANPQARLDFNYQINGGGYQATPTLSLLNGNVGIGTTGPGTKLDVAVGATNDKIRLTGKADNSVVGQIGYANGAGMYLELADEAGNSDVLLRTYGDSYFNAGNVGIGTTTFGTSANKVLSFGGPATAPTTRPADVFTVYPLDAAGAGTMGLAWMSEDNGIGILGSRGGFGTLAPGQFVELEETETIAASPADGYAAALRLDPGYTAATALTVTRHNYIDVQDVSVAGVGPAAVTDSALFRFDNIPGTHKALAANGAVATILGSIGPTGAQTTVQGWLKINVNGTLRYLPFW